MEKSNHSTYPIDRISRLENVLGIPSRDSSNDSDFFVTTKSSKQLPPELEKIASSAHIVNVQQLIDIDPTAWKYQTSHSTILMNIFAPALINTIIQIPPYKQGGKLVYSINVFFLSPMHREIGLVAYRQASYKKNLPPPIIHHSLGQFPDLKTRTKHLSTLLRRLKDNKTISSYKISEFAMFHQEGNICTVPLYIIAVQGNWSSSSDDRALPLFKLGYDCSPSSPQFPQFEAAIINHAKDLSALPPKKPNATPSTPKSAPEIPTSSPVVPPPSMTPQPPPLRRSPQIYPPAKRLNTNISPSSSLTEYPPLPQSPMSQQPTNVLKDKSEQVANTLPSAPNKHHTANQHQQVSQGQHTPVNHQQQPQPPPQQQHQLQNQQQQQHLLQQQQLQQQQQQQQLQLHQQNLHQLQQQHGQQQQLQHQQQLLQQQQQHQLSQQQQQQLSQQQQHEYQQQQQQLGLQMMHQQQPFVQHPMGLQLLNQHQTIHQQPYRIQPNVQIPITQQHHISPIR